MNYHSLGDKIAKKARKNITLKASIADDLNVASFHLLLVQQTILCELADKRFVYSEAAENLEGRGMLVIRVFPMIKINCSQWC